jgi:hypothetical protein
MSKPESDIGSNERSLVSRKEILPMNLVEIVPQTPIEQIIETGNYRASDRLTQAELEKLCQEAHGQLCTMNGDTGTISITVRQFAILLRAVSTGESYLESSEVSTLTRAIITIKDVKREGENDTIGVGFQFEPPIERDAPGTAAQRAAATMLGLFHERMEQTGGRI